MVAMLRDTSIAQIGVVSLNIHPMCVLVQTSRKYRRHQNRFYKERPWARAGWWEWRRGALIGRRTSPTHGETNPFGHQCIALLLLRGKCRGFNPNAVQN